MVYEFNIEAGGIHACAAYYNKVGDLFWCYIGTRQKYFFGGVYTKVKCIVTEGFKSFACGGKGFKVWGVGVKVVVILPAIIFEYRMPVFYTGSLKNSSEFAAILMVQLHSFNHKVGNGGLAEPVGWVGGADGCDITHWSK